MAPVPARLDAVLFDFGGVVVPSPFAAFAEVERAAGLPVGAVRAVNSRNPDGNAWARLERGEVDVDTFCRDFAREADELGYRLDARAVIGSLLGPVAPAEAAVPAMLAAVHACRQAGIKTALITNNVQPLDGAGAAAWVFASFDVVVQSCVMGARKPEPTIYRTALDALHVAAEDAVMLDDLGINLKTARLLGMQTIKVIDPVAAAAELIELAQLRPISPRHTTRYG